MTRADRAGLVVQDIGRSSVKTLFHQVCIRCYGVITAATLKLLATKYKAHRRTCRRLRSKKKP